MTRALPLQRRAVTRLEQINTAAQVVIATVGRDAFTTAHIAAEAGCSIGTVYRYYKSRVDVLDALYPRRREALTLLDNPQNALADRSILRSKK